jgi:calcineurin-like phosphoesterase family protein
MRHGIRQLEELLPAGASLYATSDTHYFHSNVIKYCARPFPDFHAMNEALIANHNAVVRPQDVVVHLGDMGFGRDCTPEGLRAIRERLNGTFVLIKGNHDHKPTKWLLPKDKCFEELYLGKNVYLTHIPPAVMPNEEVDVCLHGHVHEQYDDFMVFNPVHMKNIRYVNAGVDVRGFRPVTLTELGIEVEGWML